ncbi:hypothetical protein PSTT_16892 [Puccinia striiformis]|uniref:Uncharacterized protein n=1 Tax=Puccinia striiformis TaxID=27350 RepID=A0A2S4UAT7_9BASI|nr:hypothetical protein PSTT_16892 [Puccinia striiformis]
MSSALMNQAHKITRSLAPQSFNRPDHRHFRGNGHHLECQRLRRLRLASYWHWLDTKSRDQRSSLMQNYLPSHGLSSQSTTPTTPDEPEQLEEEYTSLLSVPELSFGTLTGICAGVFYLHSSSLINVDWRTWASRYESRFWSTKEPRSTTPSKSIVARFLDFLTADFQYRSTFTVGFFLGLRIG